MAVIVLSGLSFVAAAVYGLSGMFSAGDISAALAVEPLTEPMAPMRHTVMVMGDETKRFVIRHGIQGNRQFFIVSSRSDHDTTGDELSVYDKGTFTGASQVKAGAKVEIKSNWDKSKRGYFLADGHVLGWEVFADTWAVIRSHGPGDPKQRLLDLAGQVVSSYSVPMQAPFSLSYAPEGFIPTHASLNRLDRAWRVEVRPEQGHQRAAGGSADRQRRTPRGSGRRADPEQSR